MEVINIAIASLSVSCIVDAIHPTPYNCDRSLNFFRIDTYLTYGDSTGQVGIMDVLSGSQQFKCIMAHDGNISSMAHTPCGRLLISGGNDCKGNEVNW